MQIKNPYIQYMYSYPHKTAYGSLGNIDISKFFSFLMGQNNSLYFHIPFCESKCGYCNLFSLAGQKEQFMWDYVDAMERQAEQYKNVMPAEVDFSDLTLGGGTPLILPEWLLKRVLGMAEDYFGFQPKEHEVVVETSPNQTTEEKLHLLKEYGVTRVSLGVQSFQEEELKKLYRRHTAERAKKALSLIKQVHFSTVNVDLIYGIPGQTKESLLDSLEQALIFEPEELFIYPLYVKPGTGLYYHQSEITVSNTAFNEKVLPQKIYDPPKMYELYQFVREQLNNRGFQAQSMRRFVKKPNIGDKTGIGTSLCGFDNTLSIGCGGRSYLGNLHFCTPYAIRQDRCTSIVKDYIKKTDYIHADFGYLLSQEEEKRRYVIRHILFGTGVDRADYRLHFHGEVEQDFREITEWINNGCAAKSEWQIRLTEKGVSLSDYLGPQLISSEVRDKMEKWGKTDDT